MKEWKSIESDPLKLSDDSLYHLDRAFTDGNIVFLQCHFVFLIDPLTECSSMSEQESMRIFLLELNAIK